MLQMLEPTLENVVLYMPATIRDDGRKIKPSPPGTKLYVGSYSVGSIYPTLIILGTNEAVRVINPV